MMAEYIERDETLHRMKVDIRPPFAVVADMPAADVAPVQRWIPVEDMTPELDEPVLVVVNGKPQSNITLDHALEFAEYSTECGWIVSKWPEWENANVTHWMPLPELPKEDA